MCFFTCFVFYSFLFTFVSLCLDDCNCSGAFTFLFVYTTKKTEINAIHESRRKNIQVDFIRKRLCSGVGWLFIRVCASLSVPGYFYTILIIHIRLFSLFQEFLFNFRTIFFARRSLRFRIHNSNSKEQFCDTLSGQWLKKGIEKRLIVCLWTDR